MPDFKTPLRRFIEENFLMDARGRDLSDTDSFMGRHIVDSTGFLELVMFIEETWGVTVADDEMVPDNLDSLDALQGYLTRKLAG
jgi:acyl carrier protein